MARRPSRCRRSAREGHGQRQRVFLVRPAAAAARDGDGELAARDERGAPAVAGERERLGGLLRPGPTFTNVNDFRAIVVDSPAEPAKS